MTDRIHTLDQVTIDRIAAGEVVERPASVVKELVENALDAGATAVSIGVEDGGRKLISVRDDGCGMSPRDAGVAFGRHATSKVSSIDDLRTLSSYGFRGEALSSIGAVAKVTLRTREYGAEEGTEVAVDGGAKTRVSVVGCAPGTEVVVEDLFGHVPARRKFLKHKNVELAHCREVVVSYMLCRPGLSFSFRSDGQTSLVHVAAEGMKGSLAAAFGVKVAENMLYGDVESDGVRVEVYLGRLEHTRASPADLKLFVNHRPVRSPRLVSAVVGAYGSRLMKDRYPVGVVRVLVDGSGLDVNVHPSKREVRFDDEAKVLGVVSKCVSKALEQPDLSFKYDLTRFSESFEPVEGVPGSPMDKSVQSRLVVTAEKTARAEPPVIVPLAQIMDTYILAESRGNLLLIDQHAASERVVYESVLRSINDGKEVSQKLLSPLILHLTPSEARVLEENRKELERSGFEVERFGKDAYAVRSLPTVLGVTQGESSFRNILSDFANAAPSKKVGLDVIWRVACHTAIRAGDRLSEEQMRQLVAELMRTESPYTCEHGRPTMVVLSPADLERLFKRRV